LKLPESIKIGATDYEIKQLPAADSSHTAGKCESFVPSPYIALSPDLVGGAAVDTLIHEILHACWSFFNLPKKLKEERAVTVMASGLAMVLRDNPEILKAIQAELK